MRPFTGLCCIPAYLGSNQCTICFEVGSKLHGAVHLMMLDIKVTQKMPQKAAVHALCMAWKGGRGAREPCEVCEGVGGGWMGGCKPYAVRQLKSRSQRQD